MFDLDGGDIPSMDDAVRIVAESLGVATEVQCRALLLLSICVDASTETLGSLAEKVWLDELWDAQKDVRDLLDSPLVETVGEGLRVIPEIAPILALYFRETDPEAFLEAHSLLVQIEHERFSRDLASEDEWVQADAWFARSRQAFYLCPLQPSSAATEFGAAFDTAPPEDALTARIWLSTLVIRQETWLGGQARLLAFFRGFRAYVGGNRASARKEFQDVLAEQRPDEYEAIAQHLLAMCLPLEERLPHLRASVALSREIGLSRNEVMARNTQVTTHLALARRADDRGVADVVKREVHEALTAADENMSRVCEVPEKMFAGYVHGGHARALWYSVAGLRGERARSDEAVAMLPVVLQEFQDALVGSDASDAASSSLLVLNEVASVHRDAERYVDAVSTLEEAVERSTSWDDPAALRRLRKTARSLRSRVPRSARDRVAAIEAALSMRT